jgi:hypothetical protein
MPAGIAGGTVAGEPLIMFALVIEPSTLLDLFNPVTKGADTMPTNDRAGDFGIRGGRPCLSRIGVVFVGESVERRVKDVLSAS